MNLSLFCLHLGHFQSSGNSSNGIPTKITVNNDTLDLLIYDTFTLVATTNPEGLKVTFVQDDSGVYIVDENGLVTALKNGTGSIEVKVGGDGVYAKNSTIVTVKVSKIPTTINLTKDSFTLNIDDSIDTGASLTPADAGTLTYTSNDTNVVTVDNAGKITAISQGYAKITVSYTGNETYAAAENKTIYVTVNLKNANVTVNNSTLDLLIDDTFTLLATTNPEGLNVTFVPDESGVYSIDENGLVTALKNGTGTITVKVTGNKDYAENSTVITVTVNKVPTEITVDSASLDLFVGDENIIVATLTPADAGTLTYTSNDTNVAKVENGKIIAVGPGLAKITVSFTGNEKYVAVNKTIQVTVNNKPSPTPNKVATKIIANKKTFTLEEKNKKYTITLKNSKGKTITKAPVTLKIKGKKYTAKTNNKGVATFKIKLNKKGKYTATIKYAGNSKYKQSSKKVKITIKPFKKIGKGSKDKSTVKKIQKALKKNGYYRYAENRYLKIDGKYHKWTFRSVKKYQKDNKLKATGTVNYTTALKLGII